MNTIHVFDVDRDHLVYLNIDTIKSYREETLKDGTKETHIRSVDDKEYIFHNRLTTFVEKLAENS